MITDGLKIGNYKCFLDEPQGFSNWGSINLIIGRNNSGKSRLLDLISYCCDMRSVAFVAPTFLSIEGVLEHADVEAAFSKNQSGGDIPMNHWVYGSRFVGKRFEYRRLGNQVDFVLVDGEKPAHGEGNFKRMFLAAGVPFAGKNYFHIAAERSIQKEPESNEWITPTGAGATSVVQRYLMDSGLPSQLIEIDLLNAINQVFEPDNSFTKILVQKHSDGFWEIYLEERGKGRIPLSASGSGLQTIILILLLLVVAPVAKSVRPSDMVLAIEEPENNLHPALQRRLLSYLQDFARDKGTIFFVTTHSTVAIDQFVGQTTARLIHVRHDGREARTATVEAYADGREILRDLDVRASDLLQSNGIIWVEGPTDRLYINKWIEIYSEGKLREGTHYQCVFYGGRLLSHLSADGDLSMRKELIDLITINRNSAIVIDSDRKSPMGRLNLSKSRIKFEFERISAFVWVTKGREIENYLQAEVLERVFGPAADLPSSYQKVFEWVVADQKRKKRSPDKITLASMAVDHMLGKQSLDILDLSEQIDALTQQIQKWNNI